MWYAYTATEDAELTVSTCGTAEFDTDLAVYDGTVDTVATHTIRLHRVLRAPPERVYRAFLDEPILPPPGRLRGRAVGLLPPPSLRLTLWPSRCPSSRD